jgi:hypothetical protein
VIERPTTQQDIERAALERTETSRSRDGGPERFERLARPVGAASHISVDKRRGIHGPRRSAGNAVDAQPLLLEQPIEDAPREGAVRSPTL